MALSVEMLSRLHDAPWPATREELIDYLERNGHPEYAINDLLHELDEGVEYHMTDLFDEHLDESDEYEEDYE